LIVSLVDGRLHGSYPETVFEEVIETNRGGTWTIINRTKRKTPQIVASKKLIAAEIRVQLRPKLGFL